jgi:hypothetical protein
MAIKHKGHLGYGIVLFISFFVVLFLMFSHIFPKAPDGSSQNGLQWADRMFNRLSKGSSYFIPKVAKSNEAFMGQMFSVTLKMSKAEDKPGDAEKRAERSAALFTVNEGIAKAELIGTELKIEGDLGKVLAVALRDSETMYRNEGDKIKALYATAMKTDDMKQMFRQWYNVLDRMNKQFVNEKKAAEAKIVSDVMKKAVEASYNFYGVQPENIKDKIPLVSGLLVFYVIYTLWWGFAIFFLFEGVGLSMTKAKVKKEV